MHGSFPGPRNQTMSKGKICFGGQEGAPGLVIIPGVKVLTFSVSRVLRKTPSFVGSHHKVQRLFLSHMLRLQARDGTEVSCSTTLVKMFSSRFTRPGLAWPFPPASFLSFLALAPGTELSAVPKLLPLSNLESTLTCHLCHSSIPSCVITP